MSNKSRLEFNIMYRHNHICIREFVIYIQRDDDVVDDDDDEHRKEKAP